MAETKNNSKLSQLEKESITQEELVKKGWEDTLTHFAHIKIYKNGNDRLLYDTKTKTVEYRYPFPEENTLIN